MATRPLSTTVSRYQRLNLSRRRGNAVRQSLAAAGVIESVTIVTRSGQVVLYQLTEFGRTVCSAAGVELKSRPRESLEHSFWVNRTAEYFEKKGFEITREHVIKGNGAIDLLAVRSGESVAIEVETGKSDIKANLSHIKRCGFDKMILVATSPAAVSACQKAIESVGDSSSGTIKLLTWLDIS
ncbi:MAG: hypothetical protein BWY69_00216 [Planctomycetes bacterium ADurb.Bin401]|nr:MAG: hypothetical protein BWY69_00216 [Planctomycetes bacterium ADurb.Bin401]